MLVFGALIVPLMWLARTVALLSMLMLDSWLCAAGRCSVACKKGSMSGTCIVPAAVTSLAPVTALEVGVILVVRESAGEEPWLAAGADVCVMK